MLTFSNNVEPANGFLVRYLRRKLVESDSDINANREELLRVLDWVPKLWYHLHTFLEKHSTSDFLIGTAPSPAASHLEAAPFPSRVFRELRSHRPCGFRLGTKLLSKHPCNSAIRALTPGTHVPHDIREGGKAFRRQNKASPCSTPALPAPSTSLALIMEMVLIS